MCMFINIEISEKFIFVCNFVLILNFFEHFIFIMEIQRDTEHEQGRGRDRGRQNLKQAPGSELSAQSPTRGSNSQTEIMT